MRVLQHVLRQLAARSDQASAILLSEGVASHPLRIITQFTSLQPQQWQPAAGFSTAKKSESDSDSDEEGPDRAAGQHLRRVRRRELQGKVDEGLALADNALNDEQLIKMERQEQILQLLASSSTGTPGASAFVESFFSSAASLEERNGLEEGDANEEEEEEWDEEGPSALTAEQKNDVLKQLQGLRKGAQR
jgi:hypothetical protein